MVEEKNDGKQRCEWCLKDSLYMNYHDEEWGEVCKDDNVLFENLILETFQAGLSWHTILKKREGFRQAFDGFDAQKMANYTEQKVQELLSNAEIIRHRGKINAAIYNAKCFLRLQSEHGNFYNFIWKFTDYQTIYLEVNSRADIKTTIPESDAMSKALKQEGFKFVGSTTCMAYMEAVGMVSDHFAYCWKAKSTLQI